MGKKAEYSDSRKEDWGNEPKYIYILHSCMYVAAMDANSSTVNDKNNQMNTQNDVNYYTPSHGQKKKRIINQPINYTQPIYNRYTTNIQPIYNRSG